MAEANNKILPRMLERLFAGLLSGPNLNCRPHSSRQRVDLMQLEKFCDLKPAKVLWELLGPQRSVKVSGKVPQPKRLRKNFEKKHRDSGEAESKPIHEKEPEKELTPEELAAQKHWSDQQALLSKLRIVVDEARTYEQDTGVHVLNVGFPLLSLPPGSLKASVNRAASRRVLAPIAFIPIAISIRSGAAPTVEIACKGEGVDLISPNTALLAWLEQQTGTAATELFADEKGQDPWREIGGLIQHVAKTLKLPIPVSLQDLLAPPAAPPPPASPPPLVEKTVDPAPGQVVAADAPSPAEPEVAEAAPAAEPFVPALEKLQLQAAPRSDDEEASAAIVPAAVVGLFPMNNQGLLRDMQAMVAGEALDGPVRSFIDVGVSLDEPKETQYDHEAWSGQKRRRSFPDERFVTVSDPCQARAVRLARMQRARRPRPAGYRQEPDDHQHHRRPPGPRRTRSVGVRQAYRPRCRRQPHGGDGLALALRPGVRRPARSTRVVPFDARTRLEALTEAKSDEFADKKLAKVDAELEKLHAELTEYWSFLAEKDRERGTSFHELMGQWLATREPHGVKLDPAQLKGVRGDDYDKHEQDLKDILKRGEEIAFGKHPWRESTQIHLNDFLAQPMDHWREELGTVP